MANSLATPGAQSAPVQDAMPQSPPPLPSQEWFTGAGGQQQGPFDPAGLAEQARTGALTRETLVWKAGMAKWAPAGQVPELAGVFGSTPPPLPPQS
jgi:hypothetical protein